MSSIQVNDHNLINKFISDAEFPYLISFPRTGSHWLRMVMELYFETPSLVRIFYFKDATRFTCYHRHDENLNIEHENVIYLYRNPVDTVYSQLQYHKETIDDKERIKYWSELYGRHLSKWLIEERFTEKKTVLTYEGMKENINVEFKKICDHLNCKYYPEKLKNAVATVTKEEVKRKTTHDEQVMSSAEDYEYQRNYFINNYIDSIKEVITEINPYLLKIIKY